MKPSGLPRKRRQEEMACGDGKQGKGKGKGDCCHLGHTHYVPGALLNAVHTLPGMTLVKAFVLWSLTWHLAG